MNEPHRQPVDPHQKKIFSLHGHEHDGNAVLNLVCYFFRNIIFKSKTVLLS